MCRGCEYSWLKIDTVLICLATTLEMEMEEYQWFQPMISKSLKSVCLHNLLPQPAFTSSNSTLKTIEQCVKLFKDKNKNIRMASLIANFEQISHSLLVFLLPTLNK